MERIALSNKKGSTLIEMLIALTILAVVAVALMRSSLIVLQTNVQNELREEAVRIAEQRMNELRSGPGGFDNADPSGNNLDLVAGNVTFPAVNRNIRSVPARFTVSKRVVSLDTNTKQVTVTVNWQFRSQQYNHAVMSIVRRFS
jgi:type II secretion system protein I